jgi:hypothetical protein
MNPRTAGLVGLAGVLGWAGLVYLAIALYAQNPPTAAFDLELLLRAGRDVAGGHSPYDPAMLSGAAPVAERLFYSYPPPVAQAMALVSWVPSPVMFVAWSVAAVAGLGLVAGALAKRIGGVAASPAAVALTVAALAPLMFPFAIGLLFGNLDVFFPLLYGAILLGVLPAVSSRAAAGAGAAAGLASVAKLHPGSLGVWLLVRSIGSLDVRRAFAAAAAVVLAVAAVSVAVGGVGLWSDYVVVVRAGGGADLVDPRNAGPAAQIAMLVGGDSALARSLHVPVAIIALIVTAVAAARLLDPVESLAWAAAASLVVLPVTWYHYPAALIPFAIVAFLRSGARGPVVAQRVRLTVAASAVVAAVAIAWLPLMYLAIGLVLAAVRMSGGFPSKAR